MEAKITSTRKLEVYPSKATKEIETAETIFIENILKLKNEGDSILLTRRNASGLSCLAYLESRPLDAIVSQDFWRTFTKKLINEYEKICERDYKMVGTDKENLIVKKSLAPIIDALIKTDVELKSLAKNSG